MKRKYLVSLLLVLLLILAGCGSTGAKGSELPTVDRAGYEIELPKKVETIISMAPSTSQVIEELGLKDKLIGVDMQTPFYVEGVDQLAQFELMSPDLEAMAALKPDLVFVTGMSSQGGKDIYQPLKDLGIVVATIPSSESIEEIKNDNQFIADALGQSKKGKEINDKMQEAIDEIAKKAEAAESKKTVLFEIAALPTIYSFGNSTFMNELIELAGGENIFADEYSWIAVNEEAAISKNPDVILTNVNYLEDSVAEILSRDGWEQVEAVKNGDVYYIDNGYSSLPNHKIVLALQEMAKALHPEIFK